MLKKCIAAAGILAALFGVAIAGRDGSNVYTAPANSFNPAVQGQTIDPTDWNEILDDLEDALTDSVTGPETSTDHCIARWDSENGRKIQDSGVCIDDSNNVTGSASITPGSNDGGALGSATKSWSDLYIASGGVFNFANGDWVATHSTGVLTVGTGDLRITTAGTDAASVVTVGGMQTLTNKTLTSPTIDTATVNTPTVSGGTINNAAIGGSTPAAGAFTTLSATSTLTGVDVALSGHVTIDEVSAPSNPAANKGVLYVADSGGTTTLYFKDSAGAETNLLAAAAGSPVGNHTIWVPAGAMTARTTSGCAPGTSETTTNKIMLKTLDCDAGSDEFAQFHIAMPKSWNEGTVTATFYWTHGSTDTNFAVVWGIQCVSISDDDALDAAFGTAQTVTDTGGTTNDVYVTSATDAVTCGGTPAEGDITYFQVYRDANNGSDTLAVDAKLIGIKVIYTTNAANDD